MPAPDPSTEDHALRIYLSDRDSPCPGCGYNLRGLTSRYCPECHTPLRLSLQPPDQGTSALLTAILPAAATGGAGAIMLLAVLLLSRHGLPQGSEAVLFFWLPLAALWLLGVPAFWLSLPSGRSWFGRKSPSGRANIAAASIFLSAILLLLFMGLLLSML